MEEVVNKVPVAIVTGASRGLGWALAAELARLGWRLVVDARDPDRLERVVATLPDGAVIAAIPGDIADPNHRQRLADAAAKAGGPSLLVNNASVLGPSPRPTLADYPIDALERVYAVNTIAPLSLTQLVLADLERHGGQIINVTSDAAVEAYPGWGGYGSSKAGLDQLSAVLAAEHPNLRVYAFDPGDMATDLHQQAFPDDDISDRPAPETVIPALLRLVEGTLPSGRYRATDLHRTETL